jgi:hypothetical protein
MSENLETFFATRFEAQLAIEEWYACGDLNFEDEVRVVEWRDMFRVVVDNGR